MRTPLLAILLTCTLGACRTVDSNPGAPEVVWHEWSPSVFEAAQREDKLVILDLGAVWCHWCHVMEEETYGNPEVRRLLDESYLAIQVDQDARPDLSNRYGDYGWPATIVFDASGRELGKFRGFLAPRRMLGLLSAFRDDPTPGASALVDAEIEAPADASESLGEELRAQLEERRLAGYDEEHEGWGFVHKFLDAGNVELALVRASAGDAREERMARGTLDAQRALIDPVWGGVYQYSHGGVWENPHFEKILPFQAANLRVYSLAYALWGDDEYLAAARDVLRFLTTFLGDPDGAFYPSQDADLVPGEHAAGYFALGDTERRALGMPRVDTNRYARETGLGVEALSFFYGATGEAEALERARRGAEWALENRALPGGGFAHGDDDVGGPFLGDTLAMGRAFLALYNTTGERGWLQRASDAAAFIDANFRDPRGEPGLLTARPRAGATGPFAPGRQTEENVAAVRFLNLLSFAVGDEAHAELARDAMEWLAADAAANGQRILTGALLLADEELRSDPLHVTVVGEERAPASRSLIAAARALPGAYKLTELYDPGGPPLPNPAVQFPALESPAAFLCVDGACSRPLRSPIELANALAGP